MQKEHRPNFLSFMTGIGQIYGKEINPPLVEIYWQSLSNFDFADVKKAFHAHVTNPDVGQFMPKPADIVRYLEGSTQTQGLRAWAKVDAAISRVGAYESVVFDDPIIHCVIEEMGGWVTLCKLTIDDLKFRAKEFEKRYASYVLNPPGSYPARLCGIVEGQRGTQGFELAPPSYVGDKRKAELVYQQGSERINFQTGPLRILAPKNVAAMVKLSNEKAVH